MMMRRNRSLNQRRITKKKQTTIILTQRNIASQAGINTTSRNQIGTGAAGDRTTREAGVNFGKYTKTLELNGSVHYDGNERDAESRSRVQNISSSSQSFTNNNADIYSMLNKAKADLPAGEGKRATNGSKKRLRRTRTGTRSHAERKWTRAPRWSSAA